MNEANPKILIVEDSDFERKLLCAALERDYHVVAVESGTKALKVADCESSPELVLLDIGLPEGRYFGYEVCQKLKAIPCFADIPVIFLTGHDEAEDEQHGLMVGGCDYITKTKGYSHEVVRERINYHLENSRKIKRLKSEGQLKEEQCNRLRSNTLAAISSVALKQLKEPLQTLYESMDSEDSKKGTVLRLTEAAQKISALANHFSRLDTFREIPERQNLKDVITECLEEAVELAELKDVADIQTDFKNNPTVIMPPTALRQVIIGLLINAKEAAQLNELDRPEIIITAELLDGETNLTIKDNCLGIDPEIAEKVFDPFFSTQQAGEAMGIGLSFCKEILEQNGGGIELENRPQEGVTVVVKLPTVTEERVVIPGYWV